MPKFEINLTLENAARKKGGDKYEGTIEHNGRKDEIHPYIPQLVSRPDGVPAQSMKMTLEF